MKTVVTITPLRVESDTRTFKQAASVARFGYRSIVIEGEPSALTPGAVPFDLRAIRSKGSGYQTGQSKSHRSPGTKHRFVNSLRGLRARLRSSPAGPPLVFARFLIDYTIQYVIRPLRVIPAASLYYLHAPYQFPAVAIQARRHNARMIYDAHDFYSGMVDSSEITQLDERWSRAFLRWVERTCVAHADAVVTVSEGIAELQRLAFEADPVVLRNCHDPRLESPRTPVLRDALGLSKEAFLLVTIGQAKPGQAISEALEAMDRLPVHVHLAFLGRNHEQHQAEIESRGLAKRVHVVPAVSAHEVVPFIRSADGALVLYYPRSVNYTHCLPNGFFQAIAAELPVLYPELPEFTTIANTFNIGLHIDPCDASSIGSAVMTLVEQSPGERARIIENLKVAREELSWEREELKLSHLLQDILGDRE